MAVINVAITTPLALYSLSNFKKPKNNALDEAGVVVYGLAADEGGGSVTLAFIFEERVEYRAGWTHTHTQTTTHTHRHTETENTYTQTDRQTGMSS